MNLFYKVDAEHYYFLVASKQTVFFFVTITFFKHKQKDPIYNQNNLPVGWPVYVLSRYNFMRKKFQTNNCLSSDNFKSTRQTTLCPVVINRKTNTSK